MADLNKGLNIKVEQLEEDLVRLEAQVQQRQMDWEAREASLEALDEDKKVNSQFLIESSRLELWTSSMTQVCYQKIVKLN